MRAASAQPPFRQGAGTRLAGGKGRAGREGSGGDARRVPALNGPLRRARGGAAASPVGAAGGARPPRWALFAEQRTRGKGREGKGRAPEHRRWWRGRKGKGKDGARSSSYFLTNRKTALAGGAETREWGAIAKAVV